MGSATRLRWVGLLAITGALLIAAAVLAWPTSPVDDVSRAARATHDLGAIAPHRDPKAKGRAIDTAGLPCVGVALEFVREHGRSLRGRVTARCTTAADGTFVVEEAMLSGTWTVGVDRRVALQSPFAFEVADDAAPVDLTVVLFVDGEVPTNEGVVVDQDDQPIPLAQVGDGVVADAAGRFRHPCGPASRDAREGRVRYHSAKEGFEPEPTGRDYPLGTKGITLRMRAVRSTAQEVALVDPRTAAPVEDFVVVCAVRQQGGFQEPAGWWQRTSSMGPHAGGRIRVEGLPPGEVLVVVQPGCESACLVQASIIAAPSDDPLVFRLPRLAERRLEVVSPRGEPVAEALVELLLPFDDAPLSFDSDAAGPRSWPPPLVGARAFLVQTARTDAEGRVRLRGPSERFLALRVFSRDHCPEFVADVRLAGPPLRVTVQRGAAIVGVLPAKLREGLGDLTQRDRAVPPESWGPRHPWVAALGSEAASDDGPYGIRMRPLAARGTPEGPEWHDRVRMLSDYVFPIAGDDTVGVFGVKPGDCDVLLQVPTGDRSLTWLKLATVRDLRDGETRRLDLDAARLEPGDLCGRVLADGAPWSHRLVGFVRIDGADLQTRGVELSLGIECETDAHGRFAVRLLPGRWRVGVLAQGIPDGSFVGLPQEVEVRPGATTEAEFEFVRRRLTVRVVDAEGRPRAFARAALAGDHCHVDGLTDHDGRLVLDPALDEELRVWRISTGRRGEPDESRLLVGSLRVPPTPRDPEVTFVVR